MAHLPPAGPLLCVSTLDRAKHLTACISIRGVLHVVERWDTVYLASHHGEEEEGQELIVRAHGDTLEHRELLVSCSPNQ